MGYAFFNKSGTFNPLAYGLTIGDMIEVVVVGGGAGGGTFAYAGGTGGTSSFGSYATARGGNCSDSLQGAYLGGKVKVGKFDEKQCAGAGGGAGGYIPGYALAGGNGTDGLLFRVDSTGTNLVAVTLPTPAGSAGMGGAVVYAPNGAVVVNSPSAATSGATFDNESLNIWGFRGNSGLVCGGGAGSRLVNYADRSTPGGGGSGYGAGGGGGVDAAYNYATGGRGGNSGEVVRVTLALTTTQSIPITVGGGGAGAVDDKAGTSGSPSAGGHRTMHSNGVSYGGAGGYAGKAGEMGNNNQEDTLSCAGGGAGGCVEIFW